MDRMAAYVGDGASNVYTKSYLIDMVGIFLAETNNWNANIPSMDFDTDGLNVRFDVSKDFIGGYKAFVNKDEAVLKQTLSRVNDKIIAAENRLVTRGVSVCSGGGFASRPPSQDDVDLAKVLELQLNIGLAQLQGQDDKLVEEMLQKATVLESKASFVFGPPAIVVPTYEMYGNWLLERQRFEEALVQFEKSLEKGPGRRNALLGKLQAAEGTGDKPTARAIEKMISEKDS